MKSSWWNLLATAERQSDAVFVRTSGTWDVPWMHWRHWTPTAAVSPRAVNWVLWTRHCAVSNPVQPTSPGIYRQLTPASQASNLYTFHLSSSAHSSLLRLWFVWLRSENQAATCFCHNFAMKDQIVRTFQTLHRTLLLVFNFLCQYYTLHSDILYCIWHQELRTKCRRSGMTSKLSRALHVYKHLIFKVWIHWPRRDRQNQCCIEQRAFQSFVSARGKFITVMT